MSSDPLSGYYDLIFRPYIGDSYVEQAVIVALRRVDTVKFELAVDAINAWLKEFWPPGSFTFTRFRNSTYIWLVTFERAVDLVYFKLRWFEP